MKVFLQDAISKRYYAGPRRWVETRAEAMDFGKVDLAAKAYTEETTHFAEIVFDDGELPELAPRPPRRGEIKGQGPQRPRPQR